VTERLTVIVADDELQARKRLVRLLEAMPDVEVAAACASADEVLAQLATVRPDVLVLDISMPGLTGLELRARLPDAGPRVIFVTAHAQHAVEAFEVGAVDYVLKPVTGARLAKAIARTREIPARPAGVDTRIPITTRAGIVLVEPHTIIHASFDGTLVTITTALRSFITTFTLKELEERLPASFARVDRRHLLNFDEVLRLEPEADGGYVAVTRSGAYVPVSRQAGRALRRRLAL
jgi:two-component system LytT family response regulator